MKKLVFSVIILLVCFTLFGQNNMVMAVYPFDNTSGNTEFQWLGTGIMNTMMTDLSQYESVIIVDRGSMQKMLEEQKLVLSGMTADDEIAIGEYLQADAIVSGDFLIVGELIQINARAIDIKSNRIIASADSQGQLNAELFALIENISENLLEKPRTQNTETVKPTLDSLKNYALAEESYYSKEYQTAMEHIRAVVDKSPRYIPGLVLLSRISAAADDLDSAGRILKTALKEVQSQKSSPAVFAEILLWQSHVSLRSGDTGTAVNSAKKALSILESNGRASSPLSLWGNGILGDAYTGSGKLDLAEQTYRRALKARLQAYGEFHHEIAAGYNDLGRLYMRSEKYTEAVAMFGQALQTFRGMGDEKSHEYAVTLFNYGNVLKRTGDLQNAKKAFNGVISLEGVLKNNNVSWDVWREMSTISQNEGKFELASSQFKNLMQLYLSQPDPDPREVLSQHLEYARLAIERKRPNITLAYVHSAEELINNLEPGNYEDRSTFLHGMGACVLDAGYPEQAIPYLKQALAIRLDHPGADFPDLPWNYFDLAWSYRSIGKKEYLDECYQAFLRGSEILVERNGMEDRETLDYFREAGFAARDAGLKQEAAHVFRKIKPYFEARYGPDSSEAGEIKSILQELNN